jgi:hypothetical protein
MRTMMGMTLAIMVILAGCGVSPSSEQQPVGDLYRMAQIAQDAGWEQNGK